MRRALLLKGMVFAAVLTVVCTHAAHEREEQAAHRHAVEEIRHLSNDIAPLFGELKDASHHVTINGQRTFFNVETKNTGSVQAVLDQVKHECENGDLGDLGAHTQSSAIQKDHRDGNTIDDGPLTLSRVDQQVDAEDVGAELCTFRTTASQGQGQGQGGEKRVRYTLVHRIDAEHASAFTIATECDTPIEVLFPREGDAPGNDLAGVPRPRGARRVFSADVEGARYAVRIYEIAHAPLRDVVHQYNADMEAATWSHSSFTPKSSNPDDLSAELYSHAGRGRVVASFTENDRGSDGGGGMSTLIALAPL